MTICRLFDHTIFCKSYGYLHAMLRVGVIDDDYLLSVDLSGSEAMF